MEFYKSKYEAASPTLAQVNVNTNTDYALGFELYVKGEKKELTAENVKLSPSPKQYVDEVITLKYGETNDCAEWLGNGIWSVKKPFTIKPHYYVKDGAYAENKIYTDIGYYGGYYDTTGAVLVTAGTIRTSTGTVIANIRRIATADAQTHGLTAQYSALQTTGGYVSEFTVEEGMQVKAVFSGGAWVESDFIFTNKVETGVLAPDTTVNGIPAFTMKSGNEEADRMYDVEFKSESYDYKFKLFINEDETNKGNIDLNGTTPTEVSAIVNDAIAAYDSQLSTVNLSGTFDDDSTFSYNFVVKN